jgi:glucose-6-phosphate dehydrogenase assembly protein OpcA
VVTWWPDEPPADPASQPLGALAQRRVTDSAASDSATATSHDILARLAKAYQPGDTDFGWTRATPWRSVIAATLDQQVPPLREAEVAAEAGNPTADLIAAWLGVRLGIPVRRTDSAGPGITAVTFSTEGGDISLTRTDGRTATLAWPGRPERSVALHRRESAELLAEELRRLDPDEVYAETLHALGSFRVPSTPWTADA